MWHDANGEKGCHASGVTYATTPPLEHGEVLKELQKLNPKIDAKGTRKDRLHVYLSKGYGLEKLREQRQEVLTMLKIADDIEDFKRLYEKRFGPLDGQLSLFPDFFSKN